MKVVRDCVLLARLVCALGLVGGAAGPVPAIVTSTGASINTVVGADVLYANGFTGAGAVVANIEGGLIWNGHETLGHVNTFFGGPGALNEFDRHATWVGSAIGGRPTSGAGSGEHQRGIAHGAELWSGAVATFWAGEPYTLTFGSTFVSEIAPYAAALHSGIGGRTADVVNSSWGGAGGASGQSNRTLALDAIAGQTGKLIVFSAGNFGPSSNSVHDPAVGYNLMSVGALAFDGAAFSSVAAFSSRGPQVYHNPATGVITTGVKAAVDICAPGDAMTLAFYGGATGGNAGGEDPSGGAVDQYTMDLDGTSFAAPIVAGSAALLVDAARGSALSAKATDARVLKAVLMNAADRPAEWTNNASDIGGVWTTTQGLDWTWGAGSLNAGRAYGQLLGGTRDLDGLEGGAVAPVGWDYGKVSFDDAANTYALGALAAGTSFSALLTWFSQEAFDLDSLDPSTLNPISLFNLDLQLLRDGVLVAESRATRGNNNELIDWVIPTEDEYSLRVLFNGAAYNLGIGNEFAAEYGLAWWGLAVPAPGGAGVLCGVLSVLFPRRREVRAARN